jgi:hypothetical protein
LEAALRGDDHDEKRAAVERCTQQVTIESLHPIVIALAPYATVSQGETSSRFV